MKKNTHRELEIILENHKKWLTNEGGKRANLSGANLNGAYLMDANLRGADLSGANLNGAYLMDANLRGADLRGADLMGANLSDAELRGADLMGANLSDANLSDATYSNIQCPGKGSFTAFKKLNNNIIAELIIPAKAKRSSATNRKCRASEAKVVKMWDLYTKEEMLESYSRHDSTFVYEKGKTVKPTEPFCEDRWNECASGIHFFITLKEAEEY